MYHSTNNLLWIIKEAKYKSVFTTHSLNSKLLKSSAEIDWAEIIIISEINETVNLRNEWN